MDRSTAPGSTDVRQIAPVTKKRTRRGRRSYLRRRIAYLNSQIGQARADRDRKLAERRADWQAGGRSREYAEAQDQRLKALEDKRNLLRGELAGIEQRDRRGELPHALRGDR